MRTWELEPEPYATWLAAVELGRRREGRDLDPGAVIEQVVAEFFSGRTAPLGGEAVLGAEGDASASRLGDPADPAARGLLLLDAARPAVEPGSTLPLADTWGVANSADPAGPAPLLPEAGALSGAAPCSAEGASPSSLPSLLLEPLPPGPRRLAREAARLLGLREHTELLRGRLLRRVQEGRLYGEGGHRNFRSWLVARGLAPSTAFQATARDLQLDRHPEVRRALHEGRLSPTKADLLLRLRPRAEAASWLEYARTRTCRRLEEAVEVALVMATRFPLAWARRGRRPPGEDESMDEFREQAGLVSLESALGDLARAFGATAGVQTSAQASDPSGPAPPTPGATAGVQTSAQVAPTGRTIRLRVSLPEAVERLLGAAEAELRRQAGRALPAEDCLEVLLLVFLGEAGGERGPARGRLPRQVLERAGYRCEVPGCASRTNLHLHHLQRRSQGGADSLENLVVLCSAHHLRHAHGGRMRVEGDDPATRVWELGLEGGGNPWRVYVDERLVDGAALSEDAGEGEDSADLGNPRDLEGDSDSGADRVREVPAEYRAA